MTEAKALPEEVADEIGEYVINKGAVRDILDLLKSNLSLVANQDFKAGSRTWNCYCVT
jgi:histidyl-tRNA synthetase